MSLDLALPEQDITQPQLVRRNRELVILNKISETLNRSTEVYSALENTISLVAELLGLHSAWVWLLDRRGDPYLAASMNLPPFLSQPEQMEGWLCRCLRTFKEGDMEGAANLNVIECSRLKKARAGADGLRFHASIPLYLGERKLGVMNFAGPEWRRLEPDDLRLLGTIGNQVAVAVDRSRLAEEMARIARLQERNRLAREIHDTLAQELGAISLYLDSADAQLPDHPEEAHDLVRKALELSRQSLGEARDSMEYLRVSALRGRVLSEALHELATRFAHETGVEVHTSTSRAPEVLPEHMESEVYRVAQEALTNVRRHSHGRSVWLDLYADADNLVLRVRDNGHGFRARNTTGFGITGMKERARLLGGDLHINSERRAGTVVTLTVPLQTSGGHGE